MGIPAKQRDELWHFASSLGGRASELLLGYHARRETEVEIKSDGSPVTVADKECERHLRLWIRERFPEHGIIGEEFGSERENAEFVWVLDPIDGTKSFIRRIPLYGLLIGLLYQGEPCLGLIDQPFTRQRLIGDGETTLYNGQPAHVASKRKLSETLLLTTDVVNVKKYHPDAHWDALLERVETMRTWGDCYGHLMVAAGLGDIMADPVLNPWDAIPLVPILRGAGAVVTDWKGGDALASGNIVTANPWLHEQVIAVLNNAPCS
ncbi:MAG: hypothetical protein LBD01_03085 [Puniceicoccales bacterium]|jgi:myo-inositol-1(or 4)-monophosphatase|nr:hypothetical protein [Puniceicoccales bacterium]